MDVDMDMDSALKKSPGGRHCIDGVELQGEGERVQNEWDRRYPKAKQ